MEQAKRYGNIQAEIMIDNGLIHDKEIRESLTIVSLDLLLRRKQAVNVYIAITVSLARQE
jgi:predicted oxidoreductase